jgi:hypothetical protein
MVELDHQVCIRYDQGFSQANVFIDLQEWLKLTKEEFD